MLALFKNLKGDKAIWAIVALLALFSFLPVYSAAANHVFSGGKSFMYLMTKQAALWVLGFAIIYSVHKIPTHYFKGLSLIAMPVVLVLLGYTLTVETEIGGATANRWIKIPFVGVNFQTSTLASVVLMIWVARYLSKIRDKKITFKESILPLWLPIILVVGLVLPENFSTAAIIGSIAFLLCFMGGYPLKYLTAIAGTGIVLIGLFVTVLMTNPEVIPSSRAVTWKNRIERFWNGKEANDRVLSQLDKSKMAIAEGGILGKGAGKSVMKNILPESDSDFIYAIVIEEYGLAGGLALLFFYMLLLFRVVVVANGTKTVFAKLLVIGVGLPIVIQAFVHMAVTVGLFPTTGQPLPLVSRGGTAIWMTCLAIGIVLSASDKKQEDPNVLNIDENNPLEVLSGQL
ncbi:MULTISPECIES: FtsW/RodA/SpoVE family cell cycle protein [Croceitalea]|uniref:Probable peptidoglycan glycosyltransferase FtsW n=1 Tax=Croceitalea vernalis TaxID=3075599 RepID=A0ABU3BGA7_9FLAO|nr:MULTISPECIES: FtsW/RodA/SpoVE family cell cycle protein [unclassified Croceitalea]MDT0539383.1 FtsW/RodA/SpoVE family cell cycle protein [Croceitalea sp. P059]MDT0621176.1 FtsW/RodA/SpoVE family cell cycle protein [Croceitalea sp. P007]